MFAGAATRDDVLNHLNGVCNVMNTQQDAHAEYDNLTRGIEAKEESRKMQFHLYLIVITDPSLRSNTSDGVGFRDRDQSTL